MKDCWTDHRWENSVGSVETKEARHIGEHIEDDNRWARANPVSRHLKKSNTWAHGHQQQQQQENTLLLKSMRKAETFKDRSTTNDVVSPASGRSGKARKQLSLSQDELNRRVEAFIKKFDEDMRLQLHESLNQYTKLINRGVR